MIKIHDNFPKSVVNQKSNQLIEKNAPYETDEEHRKAFQNVNEIFEAQFSIFDKNKISPKYKEFHKIGDAEEDEFKYATSHRPDLRMMIEEYSKVQDIQHLLAKKLKSSF